MRFSIWPSLTQPWADVLAVAQHAEKTGWDGVYVADHFMGDEGAPWPVEIPTLEATAALGALAVATERVRLSPLVLGITYRHPAVLAKWAATVDHVSGGRLLLGVGAGWQENEHQQYGIPLGSPQQLIVPDLNIQLGAAYLSQIHGQFNGNRVLATAAYNAGPGRVRQWLRNTRHLSFDVWVETIPFDETRQYVQNVLSYSVIYGQKLNAPQPLVDWHERFFDEM